MRFSRPSTPAFTVSARSISSLTTGSDGGETALGGAFLPGNHPSLTGAGAIAGAGLAPTFIVTAFVEEAFAVEAFADPNLRVAATASKRETSPGTTRF